MTYFKKFISAKILNKNKKRFRFARFFLMNSAFIIIIFLSAAIILGAYVTQYTHDLPLITSDTFKSIQSTGRTQILDRNGRLLYNLYGDRIIDYTKIDKIGNNFKWSMIAAEDSSFYQNDGIDLNSIVRLALNSLSHTSDNLGGVSTISQQVIKNLITGNKRDASRKIREGVLAMELNQKYTKDQILEFYVNLIPMGGVNYGIKRGAYLYFNKLPSELTLAQAAYLAGIPQQPSEFAPSPIGANHPYKQIDGSFLPAGIDRQHYVLKQLEKVIKDSGINQTEIDQALIEPLHFAIDIDNNPIKAPHFVNYVINQLDQMFAQDGGDDYVRKVNLTVTTSLDLDIQLKAQETAKSMDSRLPSVWDSAKGQMEPHLGANNIGIVTLNSQNADILSMVGSKDFFAAPSQDHKFDPQTNLTTSPISMGSTMKPCMYLAYMTLTGATPSSITPNITDKDGKSKMIFDGGYRPQNYTPIANVNEDKLTITQALQRSLNIPAIFALSKLGLNNYASFCQKLGYDNEDSSEIIKGLSSVLGSSVVKLINHANVYATIANKGIRNDLTAILEIKDKNGNVIYNVKRNPRRVVDESHISMLNNILINYGFGSLNRLWEAGYYSKIAGKTGTNDSGCQRDKNDNVIMMNNDSCLTAPTNVTFSGYSANLTTIISVGNNNNYPLATTADGAAVAQTIWSDYMLSIIGRFPSPKL